MPAWYNECKFHLTFCQVWPDFKSFKEDYDALKEGFPQNNAPIKANSLMTTYYLLYAKYGNTEISNSDVGQFKMKVFANIFAYGPTWERKQEIQASLRALSESDLLTGAKQIYNHALNPSAVPSTSSLEELTYINDQNTANHKKSKMEAYSILWQSLHAEPTNDFINKFKNCFVIFVDKMPAPFYIEEEDDFELEGAI